MTLQPRKLTQDDVNRLISDYYSEIQGYTKKHLTKEQITNGIDLDIAHTTFLAVLCYYQQYNPDKSSFRTWLYAIHRRKQADYFRSRRRAPLLMLEEEICEPLYEVDYAAWLDAKLELQKFRYLLAQESEVDQKIAFLHLDKHQTFQAIAQNMDLSLSVVKGRYYRLIARLKRCLYPDD